jgi:putative hydrolase of the HAD superfamily
MIKALVFDLDGVIISSEFKTFKLLQHLLIEKEYALSDELFPQRVGKKITNFLREIFPDMPAEDQIKITNSFYTEYKNNTLKYIDPIETTVNFIKNYVGRVVFGLASVSSRDEINKILSEMKLIDKFEHIMSSDDIHKPKPDPEIYLKIVKLLGVEPQQAVAIEDSIVGCKAALSAGLHTHIFLNGFNKKEDFDKLQIGDFVQTTQDLQNLVTPTHT